MINTETEIEAGMNLVSDQIPERTFTVVQPMDRIATIRVTSNVGIQGVYVVTLDEIRACCSVVA